MQQIGLLVFDEAHHCVGNHAYCQIMIDFYHTAALQQRPQVLGLTASPTELLAPAEPQWSRKSFKKGQGGGSAAIEAAGWGLQQRLAAPLLTVAPDLKWVPAIAYQMLSNKHPAAATAASNSVVGC